MTGMKPILETKRLLLRELDHKDLPFLIELMGDPVVMEFWPNPLDKEECEKWIERQRSRYSDDGYGYWAAILKDSGELIGQAGLMRIEVGGAVETGLGYIIIRKYWGMGYATEAAQGCIDYAFATLKLDRVIAPVRPENIASERVAVKLGMRPESRTLFAGYRHSVYVMVKDQ